MISRFQSLKTKSIIFVIIVSIVPVTIISVIGYQTAQEQIQVSFNTGQLRSEAFERGNALRILFEDRIVESLLITTDTRLHELILNPDESSELEKTLKKELSDVGEMHERKSEMISVEIFDNFGKKVFSVDRSEGKVVVPIEQRFFELSKPIIQLSQAENGKRILLLVGPIFENNDQKKPIGIIVAGFDVSLIDRVLLSRSGLGESGETYLVNENMILISESRFIEDAAFDVEVDTLGVRQCLENGKQIEDVYDDYRGIKIHGVTYCAPDLGWVLLAEIDDQEVNAPLVRLTYTYIIVGIIITLTFSVLAAYLVRKKTIPIIELTKATSEVIKGNFDVKVTPKSNDEIGNLQEHFNEMTHSIKTSSSHIKQLKEIDKKKDEFVAMVTHELKNPLTPLGLSCKMLLDGNYGDLNEKQLKAVKRMSQSTETLTKLIEDFLDINRIELNRLKLDKEEIDLKEFLENTIESLKPFTIEKNIDLNLEMKREWKIKCDKKKNYSSDF